ncbi:extensin family protein [Escherichia coli]|nr:extensin family protein [Escherichia coli]
MAAYAGVAVSPIPRARPRGAVQPQPATYAQRPQPTVTARGQHGPVCGDSKIRGRKVSPIAGRLRGCGVDRPVEVTQIAGVQLSQPSVMDCKTAKALKSWINDGVKPVVGRKGGGVATLTVAAHYSCRTRNNQPGAKISEHGKGKAIDISAITPSNGTRLSVLKDWGSGAKGKMLRKMHKKACGPFGTVLGPKADRFHKDHFHFDTARHRSGPYCR